MKSKKILAAVLTAMMATTILAGCGQKTPEPAPTPAPAAGESSEKIDSDQTVNIVGYDYTSLDTAAVSDAESITSFQQVYAGLEREVQKDGKVTTELDEAKSIDKSADGLTYTITLRDDIKWSDGQPVKASDYVFAWRRLGDPKTSVGGYLMFLATELGVKGAQELAEGKGKPEDLGIVAKDDKTLVVTLAHPNPFFEKAIAFKLLVPQREDLVKSLGDQYGVDFSKMVYNGPFVISEYQKGSKIVYKKNDNYYDAKNVKLAQAVCPIINEPATLVQMFQSKQLDQTGATGANIAKLDEGKDAGGYDHITGTSSSIFYYTFNLNNPILKNAKVREALSLAYDRQEQINVVWKRFVPAYGIVPPKIQYGGTDDYRTVVTEPLKDVKDDPKQLMADGLKELGKTPADVKLLLLSGPQTSTSKAQTSYIQSKWEALGIKVEVKFSVDGPSYFADRNKGNFDIVNGGWGADYNDVASFFTPFTTGNENNNGKYSDAKYDELVKQAAQEVDPAKRADLYKQAEQILLVTDPAVTPYYYSDFQTFRYKWLKGINLPLFGGYYDLRQAYIQGREGNQ